MSKKNSTRHEFLKNAAVAGTSESAGGFSQHGLAQCIVQGLLAGENAAAENAG